ncbi:SDR family NAD(P)-dependent oxidoreductase [Paraburkholderia sp. J67]|uniref:SDR family NAD(P)-dependent oxidoreductase n=1 Tax=Paraburkholderia sp. J67 TaxID=2805435 RepID=UPI002ABE3566|nr:SDR family oxidoreductase [Paraburkholderia sp. J67]
MTGAGSPLGLGRAYALALAKEGCSVVVNDINDSADQVANEITDAGGKAVAAVAKIGTRSAGEMLVNTAVEAFGRIDILVNNAGIVSFAKVAELDEARWDEVFNVHVKGTAFCTSPAVKWMIDNQVKGKIINVTSTAGMYGEPSGGSDYCGAKAAIIGMTKTHSRELAEHGICVNAIAPGALTMDITKMPPAFKEVADKMTATSVVQRVGRPDDVTPLITFLASDDASYITGQIIAATGNSGVV